MRILFISVLSAALNIMLLSTASMAQQWDPASTEWYHPVPKVVTPGTAPGQPPSDAVVLFDGTDLSKWQSETGGEPGWVIENGELTIVPGSDVGFFKTGKNGIVTKEYFGDCQLHIEFKLPKSADNNGGNSGVFLQSRYELQILDTAFTTYVNGMQGGMYKQAAPLFNPYTGNGEWQVYDIFWTAPKFGTGGVLESPAVVTVVFNGVVVLNNYVLTGHTPYRGLPAYEAHGRLPLKLQEHGSIVAFRNIWIRNL